MVQRQEPGTFVSVLFRLFQIAMSKFYPSSYGISQEALIHEWDSVENKQLPGWAPISSDIGWACGPDSDPTLYSTSQHISAGSRQALCLWLPTFELRLELLRSPELDTTSVALLSPGESIRSKIWQVSERAHVTGVRPGQSISQAVSLCPSLTLLEPDPAHYNAAVESMLDLLSELTPIVEPAGRGRVFLGMDGLDRLLGSPSNQVSLALRSLFRIFPPPLVAATRAGMAPGKFGAWVASASARSGEPVIVKEAELGSFLAHCPVNTLPVNPLIIQRLERLGVESLGDLRRLPESSLISQFGEEGRKALMWATGRRIDPVRPWHHSKPIRVSLEFTNPVGLTETLYTALDRLIELALSRPARRDRSVVSVRVGAHFEGGGSWFVEAVLKKPTTQRERIASPLRMKMEISPPPKAVVTLFIEFTQFGASSTQTALFDRKRDGGRTLAGRSLTQEEVPDSLRDAIKELKLRLGCSPLYRVVEVDPWSRIPERRHALLNFDP